MSKHINELKNCGRYARGSIFCFSFFGFFVFWFSERDREREWLEDEQEGIDKKNEN